MPETNWGTPLRDVLADADVRLDLGAINTKLTGFLASDGRPYERPYNEIIGAIGEPLTENRVETWKKLFQDLGLLHVDAGVLYLTKFGRVLSDAYADVRREVERDRLKIASAAVGVLGRQQLLNPTTLNRGYPPDCDVLPYRAIWQAMRRLGWLHWEELHRVILRVMREDHLEEAILRIEAARHEDGYDPQNPDSATEHLGPPVYQDANQATRRITPWFSAAGFGGLLIDREPSNGRRSFTPVGSLLIPGELEENRAWHDFGDDQKSWFAYLDEAVPESGDASNETPLISTEIGDDDPVFLEVQKLLTIDQVPGVLFVGPPGTGKSWYARQIAAKFANGQSARIREVQFHPSYQYEDFVEGYVPDAQQGFRLADRHLLEMVRLAAATDGSVVLIIDEFSRTDPARVLGETMTYMESSLRGVPFYLPSGRRVAIPPNLVFLATMNPDDRSVDEIDAAMDRRWAKIDLRPDKERVRDFLSANHASGPLIGATITLFVGLQTYMELGHAFFRTVRDEDSLARLWQSQILPLARKHFRYDNDSLAAVEALWQGCIASLASNEPTAPTGSDGSPDENAS